MTSSKSVLMEETQFLVVGCGPAGGTAAREAARAGVATIVLEKDTVIGAKRVCAAGLRPGFCPDFHLPPALIHCNTPRLALFDATGAEHGVRFGPGHTTTREELDGTIAQLAQREGADVRTGSLFRSLRAQGDRTVVEYADLHSGLRKEISAAYVFLAQGSTARLETEARFAFPGWERGLMTTLQYRVYLERPAAAIAYQTLELHYYSAADGRQIVAWMFPKRDHLAIGLGFLGKMAGATLREELDRFTEGVRARLYPGVAHQVKTEGHLLYGGAPRPSLGSAGVMVGGTAAGLVDATNGEGIYEAAMSGRFAADAVSGRFRAPHRVAETYARRTRARFNRRLQHRVALMRYLENRPARFGILFDQLARTPRFSSVLQLEEHERTLGDRVYLYTQALRFAARSARA